MSADSAATRPLRVYVNERPVDVPVGATALDAARAFASDAGDAVAAGTRALTDSRGLPVAPASAAYAGAIYRLVAARHAGPGASTDAASTDAASTDAASAGAPSAPTDAGPG